MLMALEVICPLTALRTKLAQITETWLTAALSLEGSLSLCYTSLLVDYLHIGFLQNLWSLDVQLLCINRKSEVGLRVEGRYVLP